MNRNGHSSWFSNGNLIISGEYYVLAGAKALAIPLRTGQKMDVDIGENDKSIIKWTTNVFGKEWFKAEMETENIEITATSDPDIAQRLQKILNELSFLSPYVFSGGRSYNISCNIGFNPDWGWGSSATLISNLSGWAGIDPFVLNKLVSSGSGYDIAASQSPSPIFFRLADGVPEIKPAIFNPSFKDSILFVYLGKKQNTETSIIKSIGPVRKNQNLIPAISSLTHKIAEEGNLAEFMRIISEHEKIIASTLKQPRIKDERFPDFEGEIKSLGAWGGDFAMVVSPHGEAFIRNYFIKKGLDPIFRFDDIVKTGLKESE